MYRCVRCHRKMKKPGIDGMGPKCYAAEHHLERREKRPKQSVRAKKVKHDIINAPTLNLFSGHYNVVNHSKELTSQMINKIHHVDIPRGHEELKGQEFDGYIPLLELER